MKKFKGLTPCAVYEAHHADGTVTRMGFWNDASKPIDYVKGARVCALARWDNPSLVGAKWDRLAEVGPFTASIHDTEESEYHRLGAEYTRACEASQAAWEQRAAEGIFAPRKPANWLGEGSKEIVDGYIFRDGQIIGRDPRMTGAPKYKCDPMPNLDNRKPRQSVLDLKELIKRVLAEDAAAIEEARRLVA